MPNDGTHTSILIRISDQVAALRRKLEAISRRIAGSIEAQIG